MVSGEGFARFVSGRRAVRASKSTSSGIVTVIVEEEGAGEFSRVCASWAAAAAAALLLRRVFIMAGVDPVEVAGRGKVVHNYAPHAVVSASGCLSMFGSSL